MSSSNLEFLDQAIDKYEKKNKRLLKFLIGRGLYSQLMSNPVFAEEVINSSSDPENRCYRGIGFKITNNEYELTFVTGD
jgi:hypothetical protein